MENTGINNILFGFIIDDINELYELIDSVCFIGGVTRLISFDIKDDYTTIRSLNEECVETRYQFLTKNFISAKIGGRNRHGKQVAYVNEANILTIKMVVDEEDFEKPDTHVTVEAIIDEDKVWRIVDFIKM